MFDDYQCSKCNLAFTIGCHEWAGPPRGYSARSLLVCSKCGIQHAIIHPTSVKWIFNKPEIIESLPHKIVLRPLKESDISLLTVIHKFFKNRKRTKNKDHQFLPCQSCNTVGSLVGGWKFGAKCPQCTEPIYEPIRKWMT